MLLVQNFLHGQQLDDPARPLDFGELPSGLTSMSSVESSLRVEDGRAVDLPFVPFLAMVK